MLPVDVNFLIKITTLMSELSFETARINVRMVARTVFGHGPTPQTQRAAVRQTDHVNVITTYRQNKLIEGHLYDLLVLL